MYSATPGQDHRQLPESWKPLMKTSSALPEQRVQSALEPVSQPSAPEQRPLEPQS
jgi:hypothetical protein